MGDRKTIFFRQAQQEFLFFDCFKDHHCRMPLGAHPVTAVANELHHTTAPNIGHVFESLLLAPALSSL